MKKTFLCLGAFFLICAFSAANDLESLRYSANYGDIESLVRLGECYERGEGVPKDKTAALSYYLVAFKKDKSDKALEKRIAALGGLRFLTGGVEISGKKYVADLGSGTTLELLEIPAGSFLMGTPKTDQEYFLDEKQSRAKIDKPFYLGKTEVTQAQWSALMEKNPSFFQGETLPVECVTWQEAVLFCERLTAHERAAGRLPKGMKFSLPTEIQWEYACRAGTQTRFSFGDNETDLPFHGNVSETLAGTSVVGSFRPNAWGFYDMHGNVWEWCADTYSRVAGERTQGNASAGRVRRGGDWSCEARECRSANRAGYVPGLRNRGTGFRVALTEI